MNVVDPIYRQAEVRPDAPALIQSDVTLTFGQLRQAVESCAMQLHARGVQPGERVVVSMGLRPLHLIVVLALARLGAVSVPVNPLVPSAQRMDLVQRLGATRLVYDPAIGAAYAQDTALPAIEATLGLLAPAGGAALPWLDLHDMAFRIELSSGTTGLRKAMVHTHRQCLTALALYCSVAPGGPATRFMLYMDLNTAIGLREPLRQLVSGGCVVLPASVDASHFVSQVNSYRINAVLATPATVIQLVQAIRSAAQHNPAQGPACPGLIYFALSGSAVAPAMQQQIRDLITPSLYIRYGSTEAGLLAISTPQTLARWPDSAGQLPPWMEAQAVGDDDQPLPEGTPGRLRFRGPTFCSGYEGDEEASNRTFRGDWYYSGDIGRVTHGGLVYLGDRQDDLLNLGGVKVSPQVVENLLLSCEGIDEAAVYAVTNPANNARVLLAAVVSTQAIDEAALMRKCIQSFGKPYSPVKIVQVAALPRNAAGKLLRAELEKRTRLEQVPQRGSSG